MYLIIILLIIYIITLFFKKETYTNYNKIRPESKSNNELGVYNQTKVKKLLGCKLENDNIEEEDNEDKKEINDIDENNKRILDKNCFFYDIFYYDNKPKTFKYKEKDCNLKDNLVPSNEFDYYDFSLNFKKKPKIVRNKNIDDSYLLNKNM